jgi:peptide methionine sulfoxide reductase MsrA
MTAVAAAFAQCLRCALLVASVLFGAAVWADGASAPAGATAVATFAGGCFWCVESDFDKVPGVISTTSGYTGGTLARPSYEQVSSKTTGHAEAVEVVFDPAKVSYAQLLTYFWHSIHQDYYRKNPVRYHYYRSACGRDARLEQLWGPLAGQ